MAVVGDIIFLDYQLHDYSTDKFVRAVIKADGVEIGISPVDVPHVGDGAHFFSNPAILTFPENTSEIGITFMVFKDVGYTERLKRYGAGRDNYRLVIAEVTVDNSEIEEKLDLIIALSHASASNIELVGIVYEAEELVGLALDNVLVGFVDTGIELVGFVEDNELIGFVVDDSTVVGTI